MAQAGLGEQQVGSSGNTPVGTAACRLVCTDPVTGTKTQDSGMRGRGGKEGDSQGGEA